MEGHQLWRVTSCGGPPVVKGYQLWRVTSCGGSPFVEGDELQWRVTSCGWPPVVEGHQLCRATNCGRLPVVAVKIDQLWRMISFVVCPLWRGPVQEGDRLWRMARCGGVTSRGR